MLNDAIKKAFFAQENKKKTFWPISFITPLSLSLSLSLSYS